MHKNHSKSLQDAMAFFKPTVSSLFFLGAWVAYVLIELIQGNLNSPHFFWLAVYPLVFFYLLSCLLSAASRNTRRTGNTFKLMAFGLGFCLADQALKLLVDNYLPEGASQPILDGWLHLAHSRNLVGSWVLASLGIQRADLLMQLIVVLAAVLLLLYGLVHRYYTTLHRRSFWADVVLTMYIAGFSSFLADMLLRGFILDYIRIPGLISADLKDIFITIGTAALLTEIFENPAISLRWRGWKAEWTALKSEAIGLYDFGKADLRRLRKAL